VTRKREGVYGSFRTGESHYGVVEGFVVGDAPGCSCCRNIQLNAPEASSCSSWPNIWSATKISIESSFAPDLPPVDANPQELQPSLSQSSEQRRRRHAEWGRDPSENEAGEG